MGHSSVCFSETYPFFALLYQIYALIRSSWLKKSFLQIWTPCQVQSANAHWGGAWLRSHFCWRQLASHRLVISNSAVLVKICISLEMDQMRDQMLRWEIIILSCWVGTRTLAMSNPWEWMVISLSSWMLNRNKCKPSEIICELPAFVSMSAWTPTNA